MSDGSRRITLPRVVVAVSIIAAVAAVVMMIAGAVVVGTTWDETNNVGMLQTYFNAGWHVTSDALINGTPDPGYPFGTYVYGPVGEFLPHLVNVISGNEHWGELTTTAAAFAGRHVGTAIEACLGILAAGLTVTVITRSWRWGVLGATALAVTPLWVGHGMFNIKDSPAAVGYTIGTLGLVAILDRSYFRSRPMRLLGVGALALGALLAAGTRTALGLPLAGALVMSVALAWFIEWRRHGRSCGGYRPARRLLEGIGALALAYLLLLAIYPKAYVNPVQLGIKAVFESALYPVYEAQLTAGTWMTQPVSWTYLPLWLGAQLPLLLLAGSLIGVIVWVIGLVRGFLRPSSASPQTATQVTPVVLQALLLPAGAIVAGSTLYNGSRQMLFVVPAIAVLAVLGIWAVFQTWAPTFARHRALSIVAWALVAVGLVAPVLAQSTLFPYNYTYFNAAAVLKPVDGNWSTDYWRASGRELLRRVPATGPESCGFEQLQKGELYPCEQESMFRPYLAERGSSALPATLGEHEYWFIRENSGDLSLPPGCRPFDAITRPLFWRQVTIGQILICDDRIDTGVRDLTKPPA